MRELGANWLQGCLIYSHPDLVANGFKELEVGIANATEKGVVTLQALNYRKIEDELDT